MEMLVWLAEVEQVMKWKTKWAAIQMTAPIMVVIPMETCAVLAEVNWVMTWVIMQMAAPVM
eukprot:2019773-Ditylum_brightwellii.AAC.1